jgi:hypothetical protein
VRITVRYSAVAHGRGLRRGGMSAWGGNGSDCGEAGCCTESQAIDGQKVEFELERESKFERNLPKVMERHPDRGDAGAAAPNAGGFSQSED